MVTFVTLFAMSVIDSRFYLTTKCIEQQPNSEHSAHKNPNNIASGKNETKSSNKTIKWQIFVKPSTPLSSFRDDNTCCSMWKNCKSQQNWKSDQMVCHLVRAKDSCFFWKGDREKTVQSTFVPLLHLQRALDRHRHCAQRKKKNIFLWIKCVHCVCNSSLNVLPGVTGILTQHNWDPMENPDFCELFVPSTTRISPNFVSPGFCSSSFWNNKCAQFYCCC